MAPLIRAAALSPNTRKLSLRAPAGTVGPQPAPSDLAADAPSPAIAATALHLEALQRAWEQRAEQDLAAAREKEQKAGHAAGYAAGHAAGHTAGLADAQAAYQERRDHLDHLIGAAGEAFSAQIDGLEDIAVAIAFESLVKMLGETMATRQGVQAVVEQVLARRREEEKLSLRVCPSDFYLLLGNDKDAPWQAPAGVELIPDERIELGGCVVETGGGSLDARLETQVQALRQLLLRTRGERRAAGEAG
jgi:flagellar assembly protein FliH